MKHEVSTQLPVPSTGQGCTTPSTCPSLTASTQTAGALRTISQPPGIRPTVMRRPSNSTSSVAAPLSSGSVFVILRVVAQERGYVVVAGIEVLLAGDATRA